MTEVGGEAEGSRAGAASVKRRAKARGGLALAKTMFASFARALGHLVYRNLAATGEVRRAAALVGVGVGRARTHARTAPATKRVPRLAAAVDRHRRQHAHARARRARARRDHVLYALSHSACSMHDDLAMASWCMARVLTCTRAQVKSHAYARARRTRARRVGLVVCSRRGRHRCRRLGL